LTAALPSCVRLTSIASEIAVAVAEIVPLLVTSSLPLACVELLSKAMKDGPPPICSCSCCRVSASRPSAEIPAAVALDPALASIADSSGGGVVSAVVAEDVVVPDGGVVQTAESSRFHP
jgi:hypothetical protein